MTVESSQPILHGPLKTNRLGIVLALDLTAPQTNMVLERGSSLPRASYLVTSAARRIIELSKAGDKVESIVVTGSQADPTSHPAMKEITENLRALRTKWFPRAKLCIISESRHLDSLELRQALSMYDKLFLQFEWGTSKTFTTFTGEKGTTLASLTKELASFDHLIVQANFVRGDADNSTTSEVTNWIKKLKEVKPKEVHITTTGGTAKGKKLKAISKTRQQQIADEVAEQTGLAVSIHEYEQIVA